MTEVPEEKKFWSMPYDEVARLLGTDTEHGLSDEEAGRRLAEGGRNTLHSSSRVGRMKIFLNQLKSPLIIVLIVAGIITFAISHYRDAVFILIAVIVNSILGFYQENKAERALSELKTYLRQRSRVIRGGKEREIDAEELVEGDIIRLSQGDRVPADGRVIFVNDFQVDEALLTGESLPVTKSAGAIAEAAQLGDQDSMVFAGTLVTQGVCTAVVCRTASSTELGKIASLVTASESEKTPLQASIASFSVKASVILGSMTVVVFVIGILAGYSGLEMFLTSVAIAVSAIPEGLPVSMTVILAVGVERMAKRKGVVRKLVAAEALGSTTVILTDKTGTLTMARMELSKIIPRGISQDELLALALTNVSVLVENHQDHPKEWRMSGRIMEMALVRSAALRGVSYEKLMNKDGVIRSVPFNPVQKFSVAVVQAGSASRSVYFGAPDILIARSSLGDDVRQELLREIDALAHAGERVLGVATKGDPSAEELSFAGLITFHDPVRPGIAETVARVAKAGIKVVILTGDHRGTAVAIAREIGMRIEDDSVLDASALSAMSEDELRAVLPRLKVISRVTPLDKLRVAKLFQESGEVVAMTGDGVNDAPSIKQANIGIAMGSGTEVAQSVADLVLLDDNFDTIVAAIEEGRQIFANMRKVLVYLLSNVTDGLILIGGSLLAGIPLPLNALQILWVNFFTDSFPAVAFAFEKEPHTLDHKPRSATAGLFDPLMKFLILVIGISTSALLFVMYIVLLKMGFDETVVRTFIFAAFGTYTLLVAFSVRSLEKSIFSYPLFSNIYLTGGTVIGFILMVAAIYVPVLQGLFGTVSLSWEWIAGVAAVGMVNILLIEAAKYLFKKKLFVGI